MAYITPITDRSTSDIAWRTAKAWFCVSDWERIVNNIAEVRALVEWAHSVTIAGWEVMPAVTMSGDWAAGALFNVLERNMTRLQQAAKLVNTSNYTLSGGYAAYGRTMDYQRVNIWERVIDMIYRRYSSGLYKSRYPVTGITVVGGSMERQNQWRKE